MTRSMLATTLGLALGFGLFLTSPSSAFIRGDVDGGGAVDIGDAVTLLAHLFQPGSDPLGCADAADTNDDGIIDVSDPIYLLAALFQPGSPPPPPPHPNDGNDPTSDSLPPCDVQGLLSCSTLSQGENSGVTVSTQAVILEESEWVTFWSQHSADPIPTIDFDTEMAIVILGTFDGAGITYNIDEVEVIGSELEIRYTVVYPGVFFPATTQPHHFVKCERSLATPVWIENVIALP